MCVCVYVYIFNHCYFSLTKVPSGADVFFYLSMVHVGNALPLLQLPPSLSPSLSHLHVSGHCGTVNTAECCYVDHVCGLVGPKLQLPGSTGRQPSSTRPPHLIWRFFTVLHIYRLSFIIECVAIRFGFAIELLFNLNRWHVRFAAGGQYKAGNK